MRRFAQLIVVVVVALIMSGCGDTYRPVVIPNPPPIPDPKPAHNIFVISNNGDGNKGTGMQVNVSGDTNMGAIPLGNAPVHAALNGSGARVITANSLNDTVSLVTPASSVTSLAKTDIGLPTGSHPSFVATEENAAFYVANTGSESPFVSPSIAFVSATSNAVVDIKALPGTPGTTLSMAETPDASKLYVGSSNGNSVTPVNPIDRTFNPAIAIPTPIWVSARSDSGRVYVLSATSGDITEIDPQQNDQVIGSFVSAGPGVDYMFYDPQRNRLYVTNPGARSVTVASVSGNQATHLSTLTSFPVAARVDSIAGHHEPMTCAGSVTPLTATALPDGTRVYVTGRFVGSCVNANETVTCVASTTGQPAGNSLCLQANVFMANDFTVRDGVAIPPIPITAGAAAGVCDETRFRVFSAASADSSKVYVASCDGGRVSVIRTDTDQFANNIAAPPSAGGSSGGGAPLPQNPVFLLPGQ